MLRRSRRGGAPRGPRRRAMPRAGSRVGVVNWHRPASPHRRWQPLPSTRCPRVALRANRAFTRPRCRRRRRRCHGHQRVPRRHPRLRGGRSGAASACSAFTRHHTRTGIAVCGGSRRGQRRGQQLPEPRVPMPRVSWGRRPRAVGCRGFRVVAGRVPEARRAMPLHEEARPRASETPGGRAIHARHPRARLPAAIRAARNLAAAGPPSGEWPRCIRTPRRGMRSSTFMGMR